MDFKVFKVAVARQFAHMSQYPLFRTAAPVHDTPEGADVTRKGMWELYLRSFPEGTNPIYKARTEHDCTCCRQFIRTVGNVVAIIDGKLVSIWDAPISDPGYAAVAREMSRLVKANPIANIFLHYESTAGTDKSLTDAIGGGVLSFSHFFVNLPAVCVADKATIDADLDKTRTTQEMLYRGLETISEDAITTVLDLIAQNVLYRGEENKAAVLKFQSVKREYLRHIVGPQAADLSLPGFVWTQALTLNESVSRIRNTAIGTLLVDLSEGTLSLEDAVKSFEVKVAPSNYKRPTALVTKAMIENARKAIADLGLESALSRRYAVLTDITANNILYANRDARQGMKGDVFDDLAAQVPITSMPKKVLDKVEDVPIDRFISEILPRVSTIELMVENRHEANLVSLVAPVDATAKRLFKWDNGFSWSYNGEVADSIKERVKRAGGSITGDLCCRLAWNYSDDLDFHMIEPNGFEISFLNRRKASPSGGVLDLDANGADGQRADPAENIVYANRAKMQEGEYKLFVHNYSRRSVGTGFEAEIEFGGQTHHIAYDRVVRDGGKVVVALLSYTHKAGFKIIESLPSSATQREVWGLTTQTYRHVNVLMLSPNHWDGQGVGNRHWFFMLDGCRNDATARGFFNEFLLQDLDAHRKVIEMVGTKMRTDESDHQLSGLGFSSTQRNSVLCRVTGAFSRVINLVF